MNTWEVESPSKKDKTRQGLCILYDSGFVDRFRVELCVAPLLPWPGFNYAR